MANPIPANGQSVGASITDGNGATLRLVASQNGGANADVWVPESVYNLYFGPPVVSGTSTFSIQENTAAGTAGATLTTLSASPAATAWVVNGTDAAAFDISSGGVITLGATTNFDFETKTSYTFNAVASNGSGSSAAFPITVTVTNDAADDPVSWPNTFSLSNGNAAAAVQSDVSGARDGQIWLASGSTLVPQVYDGTNFNANTGGTVTLSGTVYNSSDIADSGVSFCWRENPGNNIRISNKSGSLIATGALPSSLTPASFTYDPAYDDFVAWSTDILDTNAYAINRTTGTVTTITVTGTTNEVPYSADYDYANDQIIYGSSSALYRMNRTSASAMSVASSSAGSFNHVLTRDGEVWWGDSSGNYTKIAV